ncbi:hypothetical protein [Acinetobacter genomosp. 15BJ]|uniref:Uncharacterized protein n=1 Tax=Acinetobacter genomosp. 15BJ TaxID=106651 RepID=R9B623_9GAMM|nr:hypothetical protein [Acinetobacter genomosp. 15BJ]EOR07811.1 hypothetical protein F896_02184 [Acinetobacter genomosp. 15BJ]MCH7291251.1 hypothetical protein [Acinetobacter genomosp. 15BJ]MDO3658001.1 hypothetical protein [Acinetobacter genomosp. 15BJ]
MVNAANQRPTVAKADIYKENRLFKRFFYFLDLNIFLSNQYDFEIDHMSKWPIQA